ncbi:unnamed protein product [Microthlaspi erraticum]|uniref:GH3 auxin-responsive promoter n=1 Tax=Microthlaspi erraticum TaxID=1685480 RepID=A0A6D2KIZ8_9BRAS|nr:unnamed protein product [Microthlaspi erraticum]
MSTLASKLKELEELTSNAKQIQDEMLEEILKANANTEYLRRFLHGSSDKNLFQKNVPVSSYEDVKPYIERVANGEPSYIISGEPITNFLLSEWITDLSCRESVSAILGGPNLELADIIEHECSQKSWEGIITRLWPNINSFKAHTTGQMSQYIPTLEFYSKDCLSSPWLMFLLKHYFGVNVNPLCKPQDVSYTFMPNMSYFEFLLVDEGINDEIVDLVDVKIGYYYEPLVTNHFGLYRYKMGDILQATGFYNSAPQFKFVRRKNVVISVQVETTTEEDLLKALNHAAHILESSGLMLMGFTCYSDISTNPGHYVLYWELKAKKTNGIVKLDNKLLVECCCVVEESFDILYKRLRSKSGQLGPLEIRVVQQGTFDSLMDYLISKGASASQYKTPLCINSPGVLAILEDKVLARFFSDKSPPV